RTDPPHQVLGAAGADGHPLGVIEVDGSTRCSPARPDGSAAPGARRRRRRWASLDVIEVDGLHQLLAGQAGRIHRTRSSAPPAPMGIPWA
ncbi:hypothetical protein KUT61_18605, partial [Pseudomonas aeruginosa]|nr:hypothetical protein [Pseudomonas aeruginosa]